MTSYMLMIQVTLAIQCLLLPSYMGTYVKQPYGPRMCESLCAAISGCDSMLFVTHDLSCRQLQNKDIEKTLVNQGSAHVLHVHQMLYNLTGICKDRSRLIKTRFNEFRCLDSPTSYCSDGFTKYDDTCFRLYQKLETKNNASRFCNEVGSRLVWLNTTQKIKNAENYLDRMDSTTVLDHYIRSIICDSMPLTKIAKRNWPRTFTICRHRK